MKNYYPIKNIKDQFIDDQGKFYQLSNNEYKSLKKDRIWPVPNFAGLFVDKKGNVYSNRSRTLIKRKISDDHRGYLIVGSKRDSDGKNYPLKVHHAMLYTFVGPMPPNHNARHIDDNGYNNCIENLCWGTTQENQKDKIKNKNKNSKSANYHKKTIRKDKSNLLIKGYDLGLTIKELSVMSEIKEPRIELILEKNRAGRS